MNLTTAIGREIDPGDPEGAFSPGNISKSDLLLEIAASLSQVHRFSGNLGPLTVAQHSVGTSSFLNAGQPGAILGLLHDATEAYLGDLPTPLKRILPGFKALEERYQNTILPRFVHAGDLRDPVWTMRLHKADLWALEAEVGALYKGSFPAYGVKSRVEFSSYCPASIWSREEAYGRFLARAIELGLPA